VSTAVAAGEVFPPVPSAQLPPPVAPVGWPAWRLRDAVASGELDPVEAVGAHLERLITVEPVLNAAAYVRHEQALADAAALGRSLVASGRPGLLCGVPVTVKDVIATAGIPTTAGSAAFAANVPRRDAVAVARLRAAGAIVIAKSNCPEFAFGVTCANALHGTTGSPWGSHSPGGSSGGDAALVAAGASALGVGTDYGGSLRWPAASCGVMALRPGLGAVDGGGQLPERGGRMDGGAELPDGPDGPQRRFQVVGPIARSARDLALAYAVLAGLPSPPANPTLAGIVFAAVPDLDGGPIGGDAMSAVTLAIEALRDAGHSVQDASGALDGLHAAYNAMRVTDPLADLRAAVADRADLIGAEVAAILAAAPSAAPSQQIAAERQHALDLLRAGVNERLRRTPVLLLPVAPAAACDFAGRAPVDGRVLAGFELMTHCRAISALGFPAVSVPVGLGAGGLPVSVQVVAAPGQEMLALAAATLLEQLLGGTPTPPWLSPES
jgi:amidase